MRIQEIKTLLSYHRWATQKIFEQVESLNDGEYYGTDLQSASIHTYLSYIVVVQHYWLSRLKGEDPFLRTEDIKTRVDLIRFWIYVQEQTQLYLSRVNLSMMKQIFYERDGNGHSYSHSWTEAILQVVLHSSTLRGQILHHLRQMNKEVGPIDFVTYSRSVPSV